MTHEILEAEGIRADLEHRILARYFGLQRIMQATGVDVPGSPRTGWGLSHLHEATNTLATALAGRVAEDAEIGRIVGERSAGLIVTDLCAPVERTTSAWWATPVGRACGWWLGGPLSVAAVPLSVAAAIMGMSRQAVHEARGKGRFADLPGGVDAAEIRDWMRRTYPLEVAS